MQTYVKREKENNESNGTEYKQLLNLGFLCTVLAILKLYQNFQLPGEKYLIYNDIYNNYKFVSALPVNYKCYGKIIVNKY